jgi:hypothetical protein
MKNAYSRYPRPRVSTFQAADMPLVNPACAVPMVDPVPINSDIINMPTINGPIRLRAVMKLVVSLAYLMDHTPTRVVRMMYPKVIPKMIVKSDISPPPSSDRFLAGAEKLF